MQSFSYNSVRLALCALLAATSPARAEPGDVEAVASLRLRGGIDLNPTLLPNGKLSAFLGLDGAFAVGRERDGVKSGVVGEIERTEYALQGALPLERYRLAAEVEKTDAGGWTLRSSSSIGNIRSDTLRTFDAVQRVRAQWTAADLRPFITAELRYTSLNESNAIFPDFLPTDHRFGRLSIVPGVTVKRGDAEIGVSVNLSATRYADEFNVFGFRRRSERVEPFLFARYQRQGLTLSGAISYLFGAWHDPDFSPVREPLYDVALTRTAGAWSFELTAQRFAAETAFPISPITISRNESAKLSWSPSERWTVSAIARSLRTSYLDSPFVARTLAYGAALSHELPHDWSVGFEVMNIRATTLDGRPVSGGAITLSVGRRFASGAKDREGASGQRQWAANPPPIAPSISAIGTQHRRSGHHPP